MSPGERLRQSPLISGRRNGKVDGMGITNPSAAAQERVVRTAYKKAHLDPNQTIYAELHGTGTPVGNPVEVRAVSCALNDTRSKEKPLLIGAVCKGIIPDQFQY